MLFEAKLAGVVMLYTVSRECISDKRTRENMRISGYEIYIDGKPWAK